MGDAGSLFLGFLLAVVVLEVGPGPDRPGHLRGPAPAPRSRCWTRRRSWSRRLRRDRPVSRGGQDHLSHRLVNLGREPGSAVVVLVLTEALLGVLAVLAGRAIVPLPIVAFAALMAIGILSFVTAARTSTTSPSSACRAAHGPGGRPGRRPRRVRHARRPRHDRRRKPPDPGVERARDGLTLVQAGDRDGAAIAFREAAGYLRRADDRLDTPMVGFGLAIPVLNSNLRASRRWRLSAIWWRAASGHPSGRPHPPAGRPGRGRGRRGQAGHACLLDAAKSLADGSNGSGGSPALSRAAAGPRRRDLADRLSTATVTADRAAEAAGLVPAIMGEGGTRRYFLAIQNNAELRGTGGFIGNFGELTATDGHLELAPRSVRGAPRAPTRRPRGSSTCPRSSASGTSGASTTSSWAHINISPISRPRPASSPSSIRSRGAADRRRHRRRSAGPCRPARADRPHLGGGLARADHVRQPGRRHPQVLPTSVSPEQEQALVLGVRGQEGHRGLHVGVVSVSLPGHRQVPLAPPPPTGHLAWCRSSVPDEQALMAELGADGSVVPVRGDSLLRGPTRTWVATPSTATCVGTVRYQVATRPVGRRGPASGQGRSP